MTSPLTSPPVLTCGDFSKDAERIWQSKLDNWTSIESERPPLDTPVLVFVDNIVLAGMYHRCGRCMEPLWFAPDGQGGNLLDEATGRIIACWKRLQQPTAP